MDAKLVSAVDRGAPDLIDDDALTELATDIPDLKSRLGIADERARSSCREACGCCSTTSGRLSVLRQGGDRKHAAAAGGADDSPDDAGHLHVRAVRDHPDHSADSRRARAHILVHSEVLPRVVSVAVFAAAAGAHEEVRGPATAAERGGEEQGDAQEDEALKGGQRGREPHGRRRERGGARRRARGSRRGGRQEGEGAKPLRAEGASTHGVGGRGKHRGAQVARRDRVAVADRGRGRRRRRGDGVAMMNARPTPSRSRRV
ncbi:LOW QUALITY PROTEIN: uncharacterized protein MICPUCDRAFT_68346 [Micromonas pusilla CCMP1545]|uniref:Predicted protein n=1 Tax=Micromonas pusilla (strain CCMP1545) TaxID=564608 RepID=C1MS23_MICPC|nr:LOW QUALITY PROTEIN: uncharacterized protein MICPUCDRAFT_68346 [Micromonas pusilla CCMP1545]EEH57066.1 predicted protein [Micromonas pusilla CCMP1545]|eukprot:XP_003058611.1 predicted protein [Micromonas pusilla CCMP1545]